ncbi:hypothetical protein ACFJIX_25255 [Roseateles sp. UC29_93]|uniref:golvesin C-terminal-like domain-containing protein n=1 Tax=Roseateles sp. UC29_93 TaxID=3350177 RepID=UPI0036720AF9
MNTYLQRRLPRVLACLLGSAAAAIAQTTTVVDNTSAGFTAGYAWTSSTAGSPTFAGANHLVASGLSNIIDNTSPNFSTIGNWSTLTDGTGIYGTNYLSAPMSSRSIYRYPAVVADNRSNSVYRFNNMWAAGTTLSGYYGQDYAYIEPNFVNYPKIVQYEVDIFNQGGISGSRQMTLSAHWPTSSTNATNTVFRVRTYGGALLAQYTVNQRQSSGEWKLLGPAFTASYESQLRIEVDATNADGRVIADAIRLDTVDSVPVNTARWQLPSNGPSGTQDVYARWPEGGLNGLAVWTAVGGNGSSKPVLTYQSQIGGRWIKVGEASLSGPQSNAVLLEESTLNGGHLAADAIAYVPQSSFPSAQWFFNTGGAPTDIYVQWSADASRAPDARYIVTTYLGSSCAVVERAITVDQRDAGAATGTYLGRFTSDRSCPAETKVELMPGNGVGTLSADAVRFVTF